MKDGSSGAGGGGTGSGFSITASAAIAATEVKSRSWRGIYAALAAKKVERPKSMMSDEVDVVRVVGGAVVEWLGRKVKVSFEEYK